MDLYLSSLKTSKESKFGLIGGFNSSLGLLGTQPDITNYFLLTQTISLPYIFHPLWASSVATKQIVKKSHTNLCLLQAIIMQTIYNIRTIFHGLSSNYFLGESQHVCSPLPSRSSSCTIPFNPPGRTSRVCPKFQVHIHRMRPCCDPCTQLSVPLSPTTMSLAGYSLGLCPDDCQEPTWHGLTSGIGQGRTY